MLSLTQDVLLYVEQVQIFESHPKSSQRNRFVKDLTDRVSLLHLHQGAAKPCEIVPCQLQTFVEVLHIDVARSCVNVLNVLTKIPQGWTKINLEAGLQVPKEKALYHDFTSA